MKRAKQRKGTMLTTIHLEVEDGRVEVRTQRRKRYALKDLLAEFDSQAPMPVDKEWDRMADVGLEVIQDGLV